MTGPSQTGPSQTGPSQTGQTLGGARRLVVKIGSALLVEQDTGRLHRRWLEALVADLARLHAAGTDVLIVSSGSIALGWRGLGLPAKPTKLAEKQAAAAVGQVRLAHAYQESLATHGIACAQVLLTIDDTENRKRFLNARNTLDALLERGAIPVINENDTVATQEIRFGDNDRLGARVAQMVGADTLVLLSDIDGLYTSDPNADPSAAFIPEVREISPAIAAMAGGVRSGYGSGGMVTKIQAARICMGAGCRMVITRGHTMGPLSALEDGARGTWFLPLGDPRGARKAWIGGALTPLGRLTVDDGAQRALEKGKSLLAAGVVAVEGDFQKGDAVEVRTRDGRVVARGLAGYGADEARVIAGHKSHEIEGRLGYRGPDEMIHRDDLATET